MIDGDLGGSDLAAAASSTTARSPGSCRPPVPNATRSCAWTGIPAPARRTATRRPPRLSRHPGPARGLPQAPAQHRTRHLPDRQPRRPASQAPLPRRRQEQRLAQTPDRRLEPAQPHRPGHYPPKRHLGTGLTTTRPCQSARSHASPPTRQLQSGKTSHPANPVWPGSPPQNRLADLSRPRSPFVQRAPSQGRRQPGRPRDARPASSPSPSSARRIRRRHACRRRPGPRPRTRQ